MRSRNWGHGSVPLPRFPRSRQNLSHGVHTAFSVGQLVPIDWFEVLPGDDLSNHSTNVARLASTFLKPVMDRLFLDVFHFYVPYRILYDNAERVWGNPNPSSYTSEDLAEFPSCSGEIVSGSVGDFLGLPLGTIRNDDPVSVLPFRAFAEIYDKYFRNQVTADEIFVQKGETASSETCNSNPWSPSNYMGLPPMANKFKDYFTSAVAEPQKGAPVQLSAVANNPVLTSSQDLVGFGTAFPTGTPLRFTSSNGSAFTLPPVGTGSVVSHLSAKSDPQDDRHVETTAQANFSDPGRAATNNDLGLIPSNLYVQNTATSVNDLRIAFQLQKMLERDAIFGSRYNEYLYGHFGERISDGRINFPEYLGGARTPLQQTQVAQTSTSSEESPLGNLSAYSWTNGKSRFVRHIPEHGLVMTVACIRYHHIYSQGIAKKWRRFKRDDFFDPLFATIGMQPIMRTEIDSSAAVDDVFGYREAWSEYRLIPSSVTGKLRPNAQNNLALWTFADNYSSPPILSQNFTDETPIFVDRTVSVESSNMPHFIFDFWFDLRGVRRMPVTSMPGYIDHY